MKAIAQALLLFMLGAFGTMVALGMVFLVTEMHLPVTKVLGVIGVVVWTLGYSFVLGCFHDLGWFDAMLYSKAEEDK